MGLILWQDSIQQSYWSKSQNEGIKPTVNKEINMQPDLAVCPFGQSSNLTNFKFNKFNPVKQLFIPSIHMAKDPADHVTQGWQEATAMGDCPDSYFFWFCLTIYLLLSHCTLSYLRLCSIFRLCILSLSSTNKINLKTTYRGCRDKFFTAQLFRGNLEECFLFPHLKRKYNTRGIRIVA